MTTERESKTHAPLTGRQYNSVEDMLAGEEVSSDVRKTVSDMDTETAIVRSLVEMRRSVGMTQQDFAARIGKTQGAISKLESSVDSDITIGDLMDYAKTTQATLMVNVGKAMNDMEHVRWHASGIRTHLKALAKAAHEDADVEQAVQAFFGEAFFNLLNILAKCHQELPNKSGVQVRMGKISRRTSPKSPGYTDTEFRVDEPQLV